MDGFYVFAILLMCMVGITGALYVVKILYYIPVDHFDDISERFLSVGSKQTTNQPLLTGRRTSSDDVHEI
jgi:hypothetical protein